MFTCFVACLTRLSLPVDLISPSEGVPALGDEHRSYGALRFNKWVPASLSASWAYDSPYHLAGKFEGSTNHGCVVSQVDIVSTLFWFLSTLIGRSTPVYHSDTATLTASTPRSTISNFRSDQGNVDALESSKLPTLPRFQTRFHEELCL